MEYRAFLTLTVEDRMALNMHGFDFDTKEAGEVRYDWIQRLGEVSGMPAQLKAIDPDTLAPSLAAKIAAL